MKNWQKIGKRNARATLAASFFTELLFIIPTWALYGTEQLGLSLTLTTALYVTISVAGGLLELPTGFLADRYGRKRVALIGALLLAIYPITFVLKAPIAVLFAVSVLSGLGSALRSGPLLALTHQSYKRSGRSDRDYNRFLSNKLVIEFAARIVSGVAGGVLYSIKPELPYVALGVAYVGTVISTAYAIDPRQGLSRLSAGSHIKETIRTMRKKEILRVMAAVYILGRLVSESIFAGYQIFFLDDQLSATQIGIIFSVIAVGSAFSSYAVRKVMLHISVYKIYIIVAFMVLITAILNYLPSTTSHILAAVVMALSTGLARIPIMALIQKYTKQQYQTTALSVFNLIVLIVSSLSTVYIGILFDLFQVDTVRLIILVESVVSLFIILMLYARFRNSDEVLD